MAVLGGIGVGLPPGSSAGQSSSGTQIVPGMLDLYNNALNRNQGYYNDVLGSYSGGQQRLSATLPGIYQGYGNVLGNVQNTLGFGGTPWGVAQPAATAIGNTLAATQGQTQQDLINRGLGNTSVLGNLAQQNAYNAAQAYGGLGAQLAQTYAGYQGQLGLAGLGAQMQGLGMQNAMTQAQAQTQASFKEPLPNVLGSYGTSSQASNGNRSGAGAMYGNPNGGTGGGFLNDNSGYLSGFSQGSGEAPGYNPFNPGVGKGRTSDYGSIDSYVSNVGDPGSGYNYGPAGGIQNPNEVDLSGLNLQQSYA